MSLSSHELAYYSPPVILPPFPTCLPTNATHTLPRCTSLFRWKTVDSWCTLGKLRKGATRPILYVLHTAYTTCHYDLIISFLPRVMFCVVGMVSIPRGQRQICTLCGSRGATVGCLLQSCKRVFHLYCALASHCTLVEAKQRKTALEEKNRDRDIDGPHTVSEFLLTSIGRFNMQPCSAPALLFSMQHRPTPHTITRMRTRTHICAHTPPLYVHHMTPHPIPYTLYPLFSLCIAVYPVCLSGTRGQARQKSYAASLATQWSVRVN